MFIFCALPPARDFYPVNEEPENVVYALWHVCTHDRSMYYMVLCNTIFLYDVTCLMVHVSQ